MDRTRYQNLEIPPQLAEVVEQAIVKGQKRRAGKDVYKRQGKYSVECDQDDL